MRGSIAVPVRRLTPILVALIVTLVGCGVVRAEIFIEPELGVRAFTGSVADLIDPGVMIGVTADVRARPRLRLSGHVDVSLHPASGDTSAQVERGLAIGLAFGVRYMPMSVRAPRVAQPYLGAEAGFTSLNWSLRDAFIFNPLHEFETQQSLLALTLGLEAGVNFRVSSGRTLGLAIGWRDHTWRSSGGTITTHFWAVEGAPGFRGDEFRVSARLGLPVSD